MGYELTDGTAGVPEVRPRRTQHGSGMSAGGMSAGGYSGGNVLNTINDVAKGVAAAAPMARKAAPTCSR